MEAHTDLSQKTRQKEVESLKIPPHSIPAEQSVLGGLMLDSQAWDQVADRVHEGDFYRHDHRLIFKTIASLIQKNRPPDVLMVADSLKEARELENAGGEIYLFELANNTPSVANIIAYADIVRERSVLRQLISSANEIASHAFNPNGRSSAELLDTAERQIFSISEQCARLEGPLGMSEYVARVMEHIHNPIKGLATGYHDLDELLSGGLHKSDLIIIAGRPSMGKTAFSMNIAQHVFMKSKLPVLMFSMEMPGQSIVTRLFSSLSRIDQKRILSGDLKDEDWLRVMSAMSLITDSPLFIDDTPGLNPAELRARARRCAKEQGQLGLIVIDYLQLMQVPGLSDNRVGEISAISRALKNLARELNVPVIALSQLNRSLEQRTDKRPVMSDLRESGAIEQDADVIAFIYRDEVYNENSPDKGTAEIIIAKHRNGAIGKARLAFLGQYTLFENLSRVVYPG